jgi:hypothetical protein
MLYDRDMEVGEIATALGVDPQTVRSTHHKAMLKLRVHFASEEQEVKNMWHYGDGSAGNRLKGREETGDGRADGQH